MRFHEWDRGDKVFGVDGLAEAHHQGDEQGEGELQYKLPPFAEAFLVVLEHLDAVIHESESSTP